jgi:hypothetical protein
MEAEDLRRIITYLEEQVALEETTPPTLRFEMPDEAAMIAAGLDPEGVRRLLGVPWLEEMVTDVRETPGFCDPGDAPEQVLRYARDVVGEYIRKRFPL